MATSNNSISGIKNIDIEYFEDKYITFGKYSGESYKYIYKNDKSYCKWLKLNIKNPDSNMIKFFEFLDLNGEGKIIQSNNIDYIINHSDEFKYFRKNRISFGKFKNYSYEDIYKEKEWYCSWFKKNVENPNGELLNFINFFKKYDNNNFILPRINYDECKILLFNKKICLNKFLD